MFYIIIFSLLAVLLVVAGLTVLTRRRTTPLQIAEGAAQGHTHTQGATPEATRRKRKAERAQSRQARRKRH